MAKRRLSLSVLIGLSLACTGCFGCTTIGPGYAGIVVNRAGSNRGVQAYPVQTGWVTYNPITESVYEWPVFVQTVVWTQNTQEGKPVNDEITFSTGDSMKISADVSMGYQLDFAKVPVFYVTFRTEDMEEFTHKFLKNLVRQHFDNIAGKYKVEDIMGDNSKFLKEVRETLQADLSEYGIAIKQFGFANIPRPPEAVILAINAKVAATQLGIQKQNEVMQETAEAAKRVARATGDANALTIKAEADSAANTKVAKSLTAELLRWQELNKWDGHLPQVTGGAMPMLNLAAK